MPGREVESRHQLLGHRPAGELPGDVTVSPRAGEPRVDVRLRAPLERAAAFGQPLQECRAADQPSLRAPQLPEIERRVLALAAVAAQHDPIRERPQHRLVIAAGEVERTDSSSSNRPSSLRSRRVVWSQTCSHCWPFAPSDRAVARGTRLRALLPPRARRDVRTRGAPERRRNRTAGSSDRVAVSGAAACCAARVRRRPQVPTGR